MWHQVWQVAAHALRLEVSYMRWATIITRISTGRFGTGRSIVRVPGVLGTGTPPVVTLVQHRTILATSRVPTTVLINNGTWCSNRCREKCSSYLIEMA